ncbi:GNAT family N-acetyltransferase [Demequina sp. SYSU T00192]|uniref:GNAT family N-acetyltransferase n=1 Tax=Demequina litoralis TaxID=3051660 RepID=A0ABT8GAT8_9MICO|nr:GNAT family N-acetyltransferase [Demequina sp. SYSU T00192]MDN4476077.1 GNAT family N-acetyltransferase [Demequina sp. SYSU T00192]
MTGTFAVRDATLADVPALVAVAAETFPLACPPGTDPEAIRVHLRDRLNADAFAAWVADPTASLVVAEDDAAVQGYALVLTGRCGDDLAAESLAGLGVDTSRIHELSKIYLRADAQGGGAAGALLEAATSAASSAHGALPMWLGTNVANERAQAFYRRSGFEVVGGRTYRVGGQDHTDVVMLRRA